MTCERRVVIFDLGGVVYDSPIVAIRRFATANRISDLNPFLSKSSAWDAFMRGKLSWKQFPEAASKESEKVNYSDGIALGVKGWGEMLECMASDVQRPLMVRAILRLREAGFTVAALTNNFATEPLPDPEKQALREKQHSEFVACFHHFIESRVVGLSKPDPRFFEFALAHIGCKPTDAIFLDDIGANLKTARDMGIDTILVKNDTDDAYLGALRKLQDLTGVILLESDVHSIGSKL